MTLPSSESLLWELRGKTGNVLTCVVYATQAGRHRLAIRLGQQLIVDDHYGRLDDALRQAALLFKEFTQTGWTKAYRRDSEDGEEH